MGCFNFILFEGLKEFSLHAEKTKQCMRQMHLDKMVWINVQTVVVSILKFESHFAGVLSYWSSRQIAPCPTNGSLPQTSKHPQAVSLVYFSDFVLICLLLFMLRPIVTICYYSICFQAKNSKPLSNHRPLLQRNHLIGS